MAEIETQSTSRNTAECSPIILRFSDQVRLVFLPTLVENATNPEACVRGHFLYQKKLKKDIWSPVQTIPLSSLKSGEGYKLELHSDELLTLLKALGPHYRLYRQQGIPRGRNTFVRLEASLARFLTLGEEDLVAFLESNREAATETLLKLIRWLSSSSEASKAVSKFAEVSPEQLPNLNALLGLASVKDALRYWKQNQGNSSEEFWQKAFSTRAYVLSQVFAYPMVVIHSKAYVGGKQIDNRGGNIVDFIGAVESTDAVVLIEIKTPQTKLLGNEYRDGVFPLSGELSGAIAQVLRYRQSLLQESHSLTAKRGGQLTISEPRCLVIAGHAGQELTNVTRKENFELLRERIHGVTIVTYDELFRRLERVIALLE